MSLELGVEVCWLRSLGCLLCLSEGVLRNTLFFSHQPDVAPQFAVTESGYSHHAKGAKNKPPKNQATPLCPLS